MEKLPEIFPTATVTFEGTVTRLSDEEMLTTVAAVAGPVRNTEPAAGTPPMFTLGDPTLKSKGVAGPTLNTVLTVVEPAEAEILPDAYAVGAVVVAVNVVLVAPAATVTLPGTVAELMVLPSDTLSPPVGAGPFKVTVPVELDPPLTSLGFMATLATVAAVTVKVADDRLEAVDAEIVVVPVVACGVVVTAKVALVAPAATVTPAGTFAIERLLASVTARPPVGAAALIVTVPVEPAPPITVVGLSETDETV